MSTHNNPASHKRKRRTDKKRSSREIKRNLRTIYSGADGLVPDLTKLDRRSRSRFTSFLIKSIVALGLLSALAWAGFFLFTQGLFQSEETLALTLEGPQEAQAGESLTYTIRYENTGDIPIANLELKLNLPDSFHIYTTIPQADRPYEWSLGSLSAGSDGAITLTGVFLAEVPSSQRLQALFTYKPANFSSEFQDIVTHKIDILDSVVALSLSGPEKALAGDTSSYIVNVQNTGESTIYNLRVVPQLPIDFLIETTQPSTEEGQLYWQIDELTPGELVAITINGSYTSSSNGEEPVIMSVGFVDEDLYLLQAQEELITDVLGGSIDYSVIINGSSENQNVRLGELLRISLNYENSSTDIVEGLTFRLDLASEQANPPIDWERASVSGGIVSGNTITWTQEEMESLESLSPGQSGVIDVLLPIKSTLGSSGADTFTATTTLTISGVGAISSIREMVSTPITLSVNSDAQISAHARYFSEAGAVVGAGPMPPEVGQTTTIRVYWGLENSLHTLEDIQMSTTLPQDVTWLESSDANIGTVSYNATTRQINWSVAKLLTEIPSAGAWFDIAINPSQADAGRYMKLTNTTSFTAMDAVTQASLSETLSNLSTEMPQDAFAAGQGIIID